MENEISDINDINEVGETGGQEQSQNALSESTLTLEELAERVAALENAVKYSLRYSGEQIDEMLDIISERNFECGSEEFKISDGHTSYYNVKIPTSFAVTDSTKILAAVRFDSAYSDPYCAFCYAVTRWQGNAYVNLRKGANLPNAGSTAYLTRGTYHVDWLVIGK